ncbi:MAG: thioredoxin domain-containing protein [Armatimonadetes bacterium]|nr:thioredoxin domain-containing protein [Armatimonadota bacterium]
MHTNRLIDARSPYLLQHAHNPVAWYEWGDEALGRARDEDRPILLSIGYSACHWCHVMERECFEDEAIAALMNERFVCIKVDREERPDLDEVYMTAAQLLTGSGGWPLNVFLTPDLKPFYAGTYFPPDDRWGRPGFPSVLQGVAEAYRTRREQLEEAAESLTAALSRGETPVPQAELSYRSIEVAVADWRRVYDQRWGGWGGAPKFPSASTIQLLLRHHRRTGEASALAMATTTLDRMASGGMYDQLGGGFHRYSVDEQWLVPHFEKMLYDNALLVPAYLDAYQVTRDGEYARVARETLDYLLRDMADASGGFHSATDADSEGEEGRYFVWRPGELARVLGPAEAELFAAAYGVTERGNFEGRSILHLPRPLGQLAAERGLDPEELRGRLDRMRETLLQERGGRVPPGKDDKVLADWNGLAISAFARAYQVLGEGRYREASERAARFVVEAMRPDGLLRHAYRGGHAYLDAYLDDYAFVLQGLLDLYGATFDPAWVERGRELAEAMLVRFWDAEAGGFFFTTADRPDLISRPKRLADSATPSGNAVAARALHLLGRLVDEAGYLRRSQETLQALIGQAARMPRAFPSLLCAMDAALAPPQDVIIVGDLAAEATQALIAAARAAFAPDRLVALSDPARAGGRAWPLMEGKGLLGGKPAAYLCDASGCRRPVATADELAELLAD